MELIELLFYSFVAPVINVSLNEDENHALENFFTSALEMLLFREGFHLIQTTDVQKFIVGLFVGATSAQHIVDRLGIVGAYFNIERIGVTHYIKYLVVRCINQQYLTLDTVQIRIGPDLIFYPPKSIHFNQLINFVTSDFPTITEAHVRRSIKKSKYIYIRRFDLDNEQGYYVRDGLGNRKKFIPSPFSPLKVNGYDALNRRYLSEVNYYVGTYHRVFYQGGLVNNFFDIFFLPQQQVYTRSDFFADQVDQETPFFHQSLAYAMSSIPHLFVTCDSAKRLIRFIRGFALNFEKEFNLGVFTKTNIMWPVADGLIIYDKSDVVNTVPNVLIISTTQPACDFQRRRENVMFVEPFNRLYKKIHATEMIFEQNIIFHSSNVYEVSASLVGHSIPMSLIRPLFEEGFDAIRIFFENVDIVKKLYESYHHLGMFVFGQSLSNSEDSPVSRYMYKYNDEKIDSKLMTVVYIYNNKAVSLSIKKNGGNTNEPLNIHDVELPRLPVGVELKACFFLQTEPDVSSVARFKEAYLDLAMTGLGFLKFHRKFENTNLVRFMSDPIDNSQPNLRTLPNHGHLLPIIDEQSGPITIENLKSEPLTFFRRLVDSARSFGMVPKSSFDFSALTFGYLSDKFFLSYPDPLDSTVLALVDHSSNQQLVLKLNVFNEMNVDHNVFTGGRKFKERYIGNKQFGQLITHALYIDLKWSRSMEEEIIAYDVLNRVLVC